MLTRVKHAACSQPQTAAGGSRGEGLGGPRGAGPGRGGPGERGRAVEQQVRSRAAGREATHRRPGRARTASRSLLPAGHGSGPAAPLSPRCPRCPRCHAPSGAAGLPARPAETQPASGQRPGAGHQVRAGGRWSRGQDQLGGQLHYQRLPRRVPAHRPRYLLR